MTSTGRMIIIQRTFLCLLAISIVAIFLIRNYRPNLFFIDFNHQLSFATVNYSVNQCPLVSPTLIGLAKVIGADEDSRWILNLVTKALVSEDTSIEMGGSYEPTECRARFNVAIVVPFCNRDVHLKAFLANLHPFLQRQQLAYTIFVIEQTNSSVFNRGLLMNIGYAEALKIRPFDCFYFHDVDLVPEDDRHTYACPEVGKPRHMAVLVNLFNYTKIYATHFGGVTAMSTKDFQTVNGFSNSYWGWGAEDDDLYRRVIHHNMNVAYHQPESEARYTMFTHKKAAANQQRFAILHDAFNRFATDGLNNLQYRLVNNLQLKSLYTYILVDIRQPN